jgi:hypothetical protein
MWILEPVYLILFGRPERGENRNLGNLQLHRAKNLYVFKRIASSWNKKARSSSAKKQKSDDRNAIDFEVKNL